MKAYRKFIIAAVGILVANGIIDEGTASTIIEVATVLLVFLVPNEG